MAGRKHTPRIREPPRDPNLPSPDGQNETTQDLSQSGHLSIPDSPTISFRRPRNMNRRTSNPDQPPDERTSLLGAGASRSRVRIHSAHGSPRAPFLSRNQSYTGKTALPPPYHQTQPPVC